MNQDQIVSWITKILVTAAGGLVAKGWGTNETWQTVAGAVAALLVMLYGHWYHGQTPPTTPAKSVVPPVKTTSLWFIIIMGACLYVGCTTSQQTTAYNTLYGLETGVTGTYKGYLDLVIKGTVPTNQVPVVSRGFNTFQAAMLPALDAVQYSTNALAPANLQTEGTDLINLITTAEGK